MLWQTQFITDSGLCQVSHALNPSFSRNNLPIIFRENSMWGFKQKIKQPCHKQVDLEFLPQSYIKINHSSLLDSYLRWLYISGRLTIRRGEQ